MGAGATHQRNSGNFERDYSFFTVLLAHFLTHDERLNANKLIGIIIGIAGVGVLIGRDVIAGLDDNLLAQAAVLGAALSYALASLYGRRLRGSERTGSGNGYVDRQQCVVTAPDTGH